MRILLITLEYPPQEGGVASYYSGLVGALKQQGYAVEVILGGRRWFTAYFGLRKAIKKLKPDIVFVGQILPLGTAAYLLRKRAPYAVFTHGMDVLMAQKSRRKKWIARKILQRAKIVVANSEFTKNQIKNCLPAEASAQAGKLEIVVMYPCPNITSDVKQEDVEALRRRLGLTGRKVLLTLGRVVERKGCDMVIGALPEILRQFPNTVYVVAGDGPYLEKLEKMAVNLSLQPHLRFMGKVSDEEKPLYYALCDLFVMPARQIGPDVEGFGTVFLEAALLGKPSIGGRSGGVPEAILDEHAGLLVNPEDSSALAKDITRLLDDDALREELGQNAKARVLREFIWQKQIGVLINRIDQNSHTGYNN